MWQSIQRNWMTNLIALVSFIYSVPQVVTAVQAWSQHQKADWRGAAAGLILTAGMAAAKDFTNHSTATEVQQSTINTNAAWTPKGAK